MKTNIIAFYPYTVNTHQYSGMIQQMISEKFFVVDYKDLRNGIFQLEDIDALYFNWIEEVMDHRDRNLIIDAMAYGIKVYWVFHNRVSHERRREQSCRDNIIFLIQHVSDIIILSHVSSGYLYEYVPNMKADIHFLPHQEYIGNYGSIVNKELKESCAHSKFIFGCIGDIRHDKNIELTIETFQRFSNNQECTLFIAGRTYSEEYLDSLKKLKGDCKNILLISGRIPDYMMNFYVQIADVLLLPYDLRSCVNSGVMLLAFTNKRTIICSNISMAEEFDDKLLYKYSYDTVEEHAEKLLSKMEEVYNDGKETVRGKGALLYEEVVSHNSKELVKKELYKILENCTLGSNKSKLINAFYKEYRDKDLWRVRAAIADAWLQDVLSGYKFLKNLRDNGMEKIGIYGYGKYGRMLHAAMKEHGLRSVCVIDQNADRIHEKVTAYTLNALKEKLDVVIVTIAEVDVEMIRRRCRELNENCFVLSLKDI